MEDLILFGMQGSGKGTQGKIVASEYGYAVFDTGFALRNIAKEGSELGNKVKFIMDKGLLVSTEIVMEVLADFVKKHNSGNPIIFDGIPRNEEQRSQFEALMTQLGRKPKALYISLSRDVAEKRLLVRKTCRDCGAIFPGDYSKEVCEKCSGGIYTRSDDNQEAINNRLDVFFAETDPIIEWYKSEGRLIEVDGIAPIAEVTGNIKKHLFSS